MKNIRIKLIDIFQRSIKWDKKDDIFQNGEDNLYPNRAELIKNNSVTAKMASEIMMQFLLGSGVEGVENFVVDEKTNLKFLELAEDIAKTIVDNKGGYVWLNYNGHFKADKMKVVPFSRVRLGQKDSLEHNGKFHIKKDWSDSKEKAIIVDAYNPNKKVILEQISNAGGINKYKGQIFYFNLERQFYYPTSRIDPVLNDCDSEYQSSIYKNELLRKGFFGKTLFVTRPLIDQTIPQTIKDENGKVIPNPEFVNAESEADTLRESIEDFLGADKAGGAMLLEADFDGEKMNEWFKVETIDSKINPDLFLNVERSLRKNILAVYNNLPIGLVEASESLFSSSGASIVEMKKQYWENTKKERLIFSRILNELLNIWHEPKADININPLIQDNDSTNNKK